MSDTGLAERFWAKVDVGHPLGCWVWTAATSHGYGHIGIGNRKRRQAHRVSYELLIGPIPEGLEIDHLCRNRACVNPDHLEPVTSQENIRRSFRNARGGLAKHGTVTRYTRRPGGCRCDRCREAMRVYNKEFRARKRMEAA